MHDIRRDSVYWFVLNTVLLIGGFFFFSRSLFSDMAVFIGILSGIIVVYGAKKAAPAHMSRKMRAASVAVCLLFGLSSFVNELLALCGSSIHFWNPPYSIGEFAVLLSGLSAAYFAFRKYPMLAASAGFPALVIMVYQIYEYMRKP